jgi:hypothetical protein
MSLKFERAFPARGIHIWPLDDGRLLLHIEEVCRLTFCAKTQLIDDPKGIVGMMNVIEEYIRNPQVFKGTRDYLTDWPEDKFGNHVDKTPQGEKTKREE